MTRQACTASRQSQWPAAAILPDGCRRSASPRRLICIATAEMARISCSSRGCVVFVRLALESDIDDIVEMARFNMEATRSTLTFDERRCRETVFQYLATAS